MRWTPRSALKLVLLISAGTRAWAAFDDGIYWPDEIYQALEVAHAQVFGYGVIPWEFVEGARNWSLPALVTVLLKGCALVGLDHPPGYVQAVKLFFGLLSVGTVWGVQRLAKALGAPAWGAVAAAALWALATPAIYFGSRSMSEVASALPLVWGVALLAAPGATRRAVLWGASLLGLAVLLRLQVATVALGVLLALALRRDWQVVLPALAVLAGWGVLYGALDAVTWGGLPGARFGGWFHSVIVYYRFNVTEGRGAHWGTADWLYYPRVLFTSMPSVAAALAVALGVAVWRRQWLVPLAVGLFLALHLATPHKEYRFLYPVLPVWCALTGAVLAPLGPEVLTRAAALLVALGLASTAQLSGLTMGQLGAYPERPDASAWDDSGPVNRLMVVAGRRPDLCGLRIDPKDLAWTGGSTYVHRRVPLYRGNVPPQSGYFNYVIGPRGYGGVEAVAEDSGLVLYRLPLDRCRDDLSYPWKLF
jgi:GPI mannosyltransferase 3